MIAAAAPDLAVGGQPLDAATRDGMESHFGHDFSQVRIHADRRAAASAGAMDALAYTVGNHIAFAPGRYSPQTVEGRRLLAHELTHVVQQGESASVPGSSGGLSVSSPGEAQEREADAVADQFPRFTSTPVLGRVRHGSVVLRKPAVGFTVHSLTLQPGHLGDPSDDGRTVAWPLDLGVASPMRAEADVEVTGGTGDPCSSHTVGWLQTVHMHWLRAHYEGWRPGHGRTVFRWTVPLPIRDGEANTIIWYSDTAHESPTACGTRVKPALDDYPTLWNLPKVHTNSLTGQPNYLVGLTRGIHFVSTLAAQKPSGFQPLRFFYWNFLMDVDFHPDTVHPQLPWRFTWKTNRAHKGAVHTGSDPTVPLFTTTTPTYNTSLTMQIQEST